jgi:hypothetical protein
MEEYDITLITAARRRFESWDKALTAAGLDYKKIVLRTPFKRRRRNAEDTPAVRNGYSAPRSRKTAAPEPVNA